MGRHPYIPEVDTEGEGLSTASTSVSASTSELIGVINIPPRPTSITIAIGFIGVLHKFL